MCILVLEIILLNSILTFYLSLYHLDSVSDWLNGLGMIGVDLPKLDNLLEMFLSSNFLNSTVKIPEINKVVPKDLNVSAVNTPVFRWVAIHEQDQLWGVMTIATTFIPGLVYGIGNILCYVTRTETYLYDDLSYSSALNVLWKSLLLALLFPMYVTWLMVRTCFHQDESNFQRLLAVILLEAYLESAPQVSNYHGVY